MVQRDFALETPVPGWTRCTADVFDHPRERAARKRDYVNVGLLPDSQVSAVELTDTCNNLPVPKVRYLRDGHTGPDIVPYLKRWEITAPLKVALCILLTRDIARGIRFQRHG